ncbi:MAG: hypothetical protein GX126_17295 [Bacteroidales bacterium]|nr:hypothetical protein [Bacteroidales bacterium]
MFLKKYKDNISGLQIFQMLRYGTLLLISIVLAKSKLPTEAIGEYEFFMFFSALICSFWINGLIQSFLPLYNNNKSFKITDERSPAIFNTFLLITFFSLLSIILIIIFKGLIIKTLVKSSDIPYFKLILLYIFFSSPAFLIEYIYLLKNQPGRMLKYGFITFCLQFIFVSFPVMLGGSVELSLTGLVIISGIRYIWILALIKKYSLPLFSPAFIKEHIHLAYPLILSTLLGGSAHYVDGLLVLSKFDSAKFAVFSYGAREFPLVLLMANALSAAFIPKFSSDKNTGKILSSLKNRSAMLMHLLFPVTIIFLLFSNWLYPRIFNLNFAESAVIINIYLLLIISRLVFPHTILIGLKKMKIIMYASLAELIVNISLSVIFINFWGIEGVAFATLIAYATQKIIWIAYNKFVLGIDPGRYIPAGLFIIYSFVTVAMFLLIYLNIGF